MIIVALLFNILPGYFAERKGYSFWSWFFSGLIGCIFIAFLPDTTSYLMPIDESAQLRHTGNRRGKILSAILVIIGIVLEVFLLLAR
jgi:hypothetical protein